MSTLRMSNDLKELIKTIINETVKHPKQKIARYALCDRSDNITYMTTNRAFPFNSIVKNTDDFKLLNNSIQYIGKEPIRCKISYNLRLDWDLASDQNYNICIGKNSSIFWPSYQGIAKNGLSQIVTYTYNMFDINPGDYFELIIQATNHDATGGSNGLLLIEEVL